MEKCDWLSFPGMTEALISSKVQYVSMYAQNYCNGYYKLKSSAITDLLVIGMSKDSEKISKFVHSKMNKDTTKWYAGELAVALNWLSWRYYESGFEKWSRFFGDLYYEFVEWVDNKSDNDEMIEFVYTFLD